ncbi:hypothetical protein LIA77_04962 [Sarocladium implicatum]|nr:hypothetical protein LIA77_04962 [Sarocladium implicatum]
MYSCSAGGTLMSVAGCVNAGESAVNWMRRLRDVHRHEEATEQMMVTDLVEQLA